MGKSLCVLLVEDSEDDAFLVLHELRRCGFEPHYEQVDTHQAMQSALERQGWDIILSDYSMPNFSGLAALQLLHNQGLDIPFILISGTVGEDSAVAAMQAGAHDYFIKGKLARLVPSIERELAEAKVRQARHQAETALHQLNAELELRVKERTAQLETSNEQLKSEIAERERAEAALAQSEEVYRLLAENSTDMIARANWKGEALYVSPAVQTLLGYAPEELLGRSFYEFIHPDDLKEASEGHLAILDGPDVTTIPARLRRKGGEYIWLETTLRTIRDPQTGRVIEIQSASRDISKRKRAEAALQESEERYRKLIELSPEGIFVQSDGLVGYANQAMAELLGTQDPSELIGKEVLPLVHPDFREVIWQRMNNKLEVGTHNPFMELKMVRLDGTTIEIESASTQLAYQGQPATQVFVHDMTTRKRLERELRQTIQKEKEFSELKSRFISMTSHEFRTPLTAILTSAEILEFYDEKLDAARKHKHLQRIQEAVKNMTALLDDVLTIGKVDAEKLSFDPQEIDLVKFCQNLVEEFQMSDNGLHRINLVMKLPNRALYVKMDGKLLRQVLSNLLSNALKYSPGQKPVDFELSCDAQLQDLIFKVRDYGIGIPSKDLPDLFEPFHRAGNVGNIPGTGLGLSIVKRCIDVQGGTIRVESEPGRGSNFTVTLPSAGRCQQGNSLI